MACHDTTPSQSTNLLHRMLAGIKTVLTAIYGGLIALAVANRRVILVEKLQEKSDAELAALGVKREDIVHYVFRDMLHV